MGIENEPLYWDKQIQELKLEHISHTPPAISAGIPVRKVPIPLSTNEEIPSSLRQMTWLFPAGKSTGNSNGRKVNPKLLVGRGKYPVTKRINSLVRDAYNRGRK